MKNVFAAAVMSVAFGCIVGGGTGCSGGKTQATYLSRDELLDPATCNKCHADHYRDWSGSMHAYASDDPVFLAMNARGQRETNGALGSFCVNCHAPIALHENQTKNGLNLATVESKYKGVTCFFCHTVDSVLGDHNDALHLANDTVMRGPFGDPVANTAHAAGYSPLHDRDHLDSAQLCGACHDVVNPNGVAIERTYDEWKNHTVFSQSPGGDTCGQCHMHQSTTPVPVAQAPGVSPRFYHGHDFPGVDIALTPFPQADTQKESVQNFLDSTIQSILCVGEGTAGIIVILDNVAAGHGWPSGSAQDRRAWVEVTAYSGSNIIYQSGVVPDGTAVTTTATQDPDLWLLRDCMLDTNNTPVPMFWQAQNPSESYQLPGTMTFDTLDPRFYLTHVYQTFPRQKVLSAAPDRVTLRVRLQAIGLDVIDDLTSSGDLTAPVRGNVPTYDIGTSPVVTWTPATAASAGVFSVWNVPISCVSNTSASFAPQVPAPAHAYCKP
jgi:hypothetical protein